jgi:arylsulfatase A-like enzyme
VSADNGGSPYGRNNALYLKMLNVGGPEGKAQAASNAPATNPNAAPDALPDNYPLRGAKQWLYEGGIRVPFIARGPGIKANSWCHQPVAQYDLLPTMVDLAGGKFLAEEIDGGSLRRVLENEGRGEISRVLDGVVFHRPNRGQSAYRSGDWKLVITWGMDDRPVKKELFDLSKDISEQSNLVEAQPEKTAAMWAALSKYLKDVNAEKVADFGGIGKKKKAKAKAASGQKVRPKKKA